MYEIVIRMRGFDGKPIWRSVHPTEGHAYAVDTEEEAREFAAKWYPDLIYGESIKAKRI